MIGGLAVAAWGRPRLTEDVDLKVSATRAEATKLTEILGPEFCPVPDAVEIAGSLGVLFLDGPGGVRLDLLLADLGFDEQALKRAVEAEIVPGFNARICTAEDVIIFKMITTRPRDREDARSIAVEQGETLDVGYIKHWLDLFQEALDDSTLTRTFSEMIG